MTQKEPLGENMRDYTFVDGYRFLVCNIYRSERYDVDRLDINCVDETKPKFVRGFHIVDHQTSVSATTDGEDADNLIYSMAFISGTYDGNLREGIDTYLEKAMLEGNFLVTTELKAPPNAEEVVH